ncbi:hypothetical protein LTR86_010409 [Recurvomyces mirabilis]|nr:hypothetical protein LTR86_010409 [Recurvomyces mirabilis]
MAETSIRGYFIDLLVAKTIRREEHHSPRESARLTESHEKTSAPVNARRKTNSYNLRSCVQRADQALKGQKPACLKRSRTHPNPSGPDKSPIHQRKRRRLLANDRIPVSASNTNRVVDEECPIAFWAANKWWPRQYFEDDRVMENILARKRSFSSKSRKNSDAGSATPGSTHQSEQKSREQKSAEYKTPQYATLLATKGVYMKPSSFGLTKTSGDNCKALLDQEQTYPQDTLFRDDHFKATCESVQDKNETRVIRDIALLIVPSAEVSAIYGATQLERLVESVNEGWNNSIPITKTRPQPDYSVGFRREAFTQEQLDRMHPIIGDFSDQSYFMATWYMYFPFLTCEVKCGAAALDVADRQNAHSTAIAVRAVVELFRAVKREKELHRENLAFSISHDHRSVRIYGYYAEITEFETKYYRHPIHEFSFTALDGKDKWTAYRFTKNVYQNWMPAHFARICTAIDQIPGDISFSVSQSELEYPEQPSGMSQELGAYSIAESSAGSATSHTRVDAQSSIEQESNVTSSTSVSGREFKKPKKNTARRGRK